MINNMSKKDLLEILEYNELYFKKQIDKINSKTHKNENEIKAYENSKISESNQDSQSSSSKTSNELRSLSSKSLSSTPAMSLTKNFSRPIIESFDENSESDNCEIINNESSIKTIKPKSRFVRKSNKSSKCIKINSEGEKQVSRRDIKFDHHFRAHNSIRGDNTVPLVTKLVDYEIRNDNLIDVYERLKFFAKECFKAGKEDFYRLKSILKEIDLYLKNYEYLNEDSDYDSDEEVFAITISKDIRQAIQEKLDLGSQLTEVERSLIA